MPPAQLEGEKKVEFRLSHVFGVSMVCLAIGLALGLYLSKALFETKMDDAIKMQRMVYKSVVYDIMPFDKTGK
jgi:hypothetical protein